MTMHFHELIREILIAQTPEGLNRALEDAHAASWNQYLDDLNRFADDGDCPDNHTVAERLYDRRQDRIATAYEERPR
jgi:hypothetical protein